MFNVLATMVTSMNKLITISVIMLILFTGCSQEDTQTNTSQKTESRN